MVKSEGAMRVAPGPKLHLFVCANRRVAGPLGAGCAERGDAVYDALKREVSARGAVASVWITKTHCLGICPKRGATVARYGSGHGAGSTSPILTEVEPENVSSLVEERAPSTSSSSTEASALDELLRLRRGGDLR